MTLSIENLSQVNRFLKQAQRAARQAIYVTNAGTDADTNVSAFRTALAAGSNAQDAAKRLIDVVNATVQ